ncbi:tetratricopeptide repeat protein [Nitrospira sp. BLG_1]|uniref:tetratricopeptide repeat protein n=1 Tax=Nitrospira sp. BLG_1 TaxID=3395883 RepID=UPI0039BCDB19
MPDIRRATVKELAHKIKGTDGAMPRFAFFLGAGASKQSGVITVNEMIRFFRNRILDESCPLTNATEEDRDKWLKGQHWYRAAGSDYSKMFEKYEPKELGRQRYIEKLIDGKSPSFGYVVLASLMAKKYIQSILTTNFDDLIYAACTSYSPIRPIVYAYGVLASEMRITASRPKILKLHGDYLYSTLKNTDTETAVQDPNMARQVAQVLAEYGLAVVGYSGNDASVMKILSSISEKNDLYWCVRRYEEPNTGVQELLRAKGGFLVEIEGFDEMMNEIRSTVELDARTMIGSIYERQTSIIEGLKELHPKYSAKILGEVVTALKDQMTHQEEQIRKTEAADYFAKAYEADEQGNYKEAVGLYRKVIKRDNGYFWAYNNLGALLLNEKNYPEAEALLKKAIDLNPGESLPCSNLALVYGGQKKYLQAIQTMIQAVRLSPQDSANANGLGWFYLLSGDFKRARRQFEQAISLDPRSWSPVFNLGIAHWLEGRKAKARTLWRKGLTMLSLDKPDEKLAHSLYSTAAQDREKRGSSLRSILQGGTFRPNQLDNALQDAEVLLNSKSPPPGVRQAVTLLKSAMTRSLKTPK